MKGIASKYTEKLQALDFPQKEKYTVVTLTDLQGHVVKEFIKGNMDQVREAGILLGSGTNLANMIKCAKTKELKWTETTLPEFNKVRSDFVNAQDQIWFEFEIEIKQAYIPAGVPEEVADEFYTKCWALAKTRSEDMGGIEELFEGFAGYLAR